MKGKDFMKNLVELSHQELDTVSGGIHWARDLSCGIIGSGPWCISITSLYRVLNPRDEHLVLDYGDVALVSVTAFGIHIAEIAAIYGIGKGLKKLFSSSKKSKETENI